MPSCYSSDVQHRSTPMYTQTCTHLVLTPKCTYTHMHNTHTCNAQYTHPHTHASLHIHQRSTLKVWKHQHPAHSLSMNMPPPAYARPHRYLYPAKAVVTLYTPISLHINFVNGHQPAPWEPTACTCARVTAPTGDVGNGDETAPDAEVVVETTEVVVETTEVGGCVGFNMAKEARISSWIKARRLSSPPESPVRPAARPRPPVPWALPQPRPWSRRVAGSGVWRVVEVGRSQCLRHHLTVWRQQTY